MNSVRTVNYYGLGCSFHRFKASGTDFGGSGSPEGGSWAHLGAALTASEAFLERAGAAWGGFEVDKTIFCDFDLILRSLLGIKIRAKSDPGRKKICNASRLGFSAHF